MNRAWPYAVLAVVVFTATAMAGGTDHTGAWILRSAACISVVLLWPTREGTLPAWSWPVPAITLAWLTTAVGIAPEPGIALQTWLTVVIALAVFWGLLSAGTEQAAKSMYILMAACAAHCVWAFISWLPARSGWRASAGFHNPNDLAAWIAPLLVLRVGTMRSPWRWPAALVFAAGLLATGSRSGLIAAVAGLGCVAVFKPQRAAIPAALLGGTLLVTVPFFLPRFLGAKDPFAFSRMTIWQRSAELALEHPFGVGLGHFAHAMRQFGVPLKDFAEGLVRYPKVASRGHSEIFTTWVELGYPGVLLLLLMSGFCCMLLWRAHRAVGIQCTAVHLGTLLALLIPAMTHETLRTPVISLTAAVWAAGVGRLAPARQDAPLPSRKLTAVALMGVMLLATPGMLTQQCMSRATALRDRGYVHEAIPYAIWAGQFSPWLEGPALLLASLDYLAHKNAMDVVERLLAIAERFPYSPRALERALWILQQPSRPMDTPVPEAVRATLIVELQKNRVARDKKNALAWYELAMAQRQVDLQAHSIESLAEAVGLEPHFARALANLAVLEQASLTPQTQKLGSPKDLARRALEAHNKKAPKDKYAQQILKLDAMTVELLKVSGLVVP